MRATAALAGALLVATCLVGPAAAEDSIVNGKPCNDLCRSWLGMPPQAAEPQSASRVPVPLRDSVPVERPLVVRVERPAAPPPDLETQPPVAFRSPDRRPQGVDAGPIQPQPQENITPDAPTRPAARMASVFIPRERLTGEAHDTSTPIVGNPHWKEYADTVFRYSGSILTPEYDRAHRAAPSTAASLQVLR